MEGVSKVLLSSLSLITYSESPQQYRWALFWLLGFLTALALWSLYLTYSLSRCTLVPLGFELTKLRGSFWGLAWMSSPLFLFLAALVVVIYCLRHFLRVILFFIVRDLYSVPSYAAFLHYKRRRLGAWLWRIPHGALLSRKTKAYSGRRYYFLFVWFFFSFFFRLLTLLMRFFFRWSLSRLHSQLGFSLVKYLSFPLAFYYLLAWQTYSSSWRSLRASLGLQFFLLYLLLRRHLYYLSINEYTYVFQYFFREKNPASQEKLGFYDRYAKDWNLASASPLRISLWRPSILSLFTRFFPLAARVTSSFCCVQLLWLSWIMQLLLEILCSFLALPFLWSMLCLNAVGNLHIQRFAWLNRTNQSSLAWFLKLKSLLQGCVLLLTFLLARVGRFAQKLFLHGLFWKLYLALWVLLLLSVQLPVYCVRGLLVCTRFVVLKSPYFLLLFLCLVFGGQLFSLLAPWLVQLLFDSSGWFLAPGEDLSVVIQSWYDSSVEQLSYWPHHPEYLGNAHASCFYWNRFYIKLQEESSILQPRAMWRSLLYWYGEYERRHDYPVLHSKKLVCFFGGRVVFGAHSQPYSHVYLLLRLLSKDLSQYPAVFVRDISMLRGIWSWVHYRWCFLEFPLLLLSNLSTILGAHYNDFYLKLLALPGLGFIASFYAAYYSFLQSLPEWLISSFSAISIEVPPAVISVFHRLFVLYEQYLIIFYNLCLWLWEIVLLLAKHLRRELQKSSYEGSLSSWYSGLLLDLLAQQWMCLPTHLLEQLKGEKFPFERIFLALICTLLWALEAFVALLVPEERLTLPWLTSLYLSFWAACERSWDSFNIYWQLSKLPWKSTGDWGNKHLFSVTRKSSWLIGKHCGRESWFSAYNYGNPKLWNYLNLCCNDQKAALGYGMETHPGVSPWYLTFTAFYDERRYILIFRLIKQSFISEPWAKIIGFFPFYDQIAGPLQWSVAQFLRWPFFGPCLYYAVLFSLMLFLRSFRLTFCLPTFTFEGGPNKPWQQFRQSADMAWAERLGVPYLPPEPWYLQRSHIRPDWTYRLPIPEFFLWWKNLREESDSSYAWQRPHIKQSLKDLWNHLPSLTVRSFTPRALRRQHWWQRRLAFDYLLSPAGSWKHSLHQMRSLSLFNEVYRLRTLLPNKAHLFFHALRHELDYTFRAARASSDWEEIEEVRAEHLFRAARVKQRLRSWSKEGKLVSFLNQRLFGQGLARESSYPEWAIIEPSALLAGEQRRLRFSPLFYSKVIHEQSHLFVVPLDTKVALPFVFWFFIFPFVIFFQGLFYHYCWKHGWSPRKGRQAGSEYMILLFNLLLHWAPWVNYYFFAWSYGSTTAHMIRAGSRFAMDDPGKWFSLAPESHHQFYYWPWLRHLRHSDSVFYPAIGLFTRELFFYDNLFELRFLSSSLALVQLLLASFVLIRCLRSKPRFFSLRSKAAASSPLAIFAQQSLLKHSKLRLKQGLLLFWLKA